MNVDSERKPTDVQFDALIDMIENDTPAWPSIDDVFESFKITLKADEVIKSANMF